MTWPVYLPLLLPALLALVAPQVAAARRPELAARVLAGAAIVVAGCSTACVGLLAATLIDDLPSAERHEQRAWVLGRALPEPVPDTVGLAAAVLLAWLGYRLIREVWRRDQAAAVLHRAGAPDGGLVVVGWERPHAVAVPGRRGLAGHVLLTTGLLRLLDGRERDVVLAHERAHLRRRHHRTAALAAAAAALSPLLCGVPAIVDLLVERSADEEAARVAGDRRFVARTLGKVALAAVRRPGLGFDGSATVRRVEALLMPPAGRSLSPLTLVAAVLAPTVTGVAVHGFAAFVSAWMH